MMRGGKRGLVLSPWTVPPVQLVASIFSGMSAAVFSDPARWMLSDRSIERPPLLDDFNQPVVVG